MDAPSASIGHGEALPSRLKPSQVAWASPEQAASSLIRRPLIALVDSNGNCPCRASHNQLGLTPSWARIAGSAATGRRYRKETTACASRGGHVMGIDAAAPQSPTQPCINLCCKPQSHSPCVHLPCKPQNRHFTVCNSVGWRSQQSNAMWSERPLCGCDSGLDLANEFPDDATKTEIKASRSFWRDSRLARRCLVSSTVASS